MQLFIIMMKVNVCMGCDKLHACEKITAIIYDHILIHLAALVDMIKHIELHQYNVYVGVK